MIVTGDGDYSRLEKYVTYDLDLDDNNGVRKKKKRLAFGLS